jgi:hypothetical protein
MNGANLPFILSFVCVALGMPYSQAISAGLNNRFSVIFAAPDGYSEFAAGLEIAEGFEGKNYRAIVPQKMDCSNGYGGQIGLILLKERSPRGAF